MAAFNYAPSRFERTFGAGAWQQVDRRIVFAAIAIGTAVALLAAIGLAQARRLAELDAQVRTLQTQAVALAAETRQVQQLSAVVGALRATRARVSAQGRATIAFANAIAEIGNGLPPHTWLTALQPGSGVVWSIGGRSTRFDEVGQLLSDLQHRDPAGDARLVSIAVSASGKILDFSLAWTPQP